MQPVDQGKAKPPAAKSAFRAWGKRGIPNNVDNVLKGGRIGEEGFVFSPVAVLGSGQPWIDHHDPTPETAGYLGQADGGQPDKGPNFNEIAGMGPRAPSRDGGKAIPLETGAALEFGRSAIDVLVVNSD